MAITSVGFADPGRQLKGHAAWARLYACALRQEEGMRAQKSALPLSASITMRAAKPSIAARPLSISALAVKGPRDSLAGSLPASRGAKDAAMKTPKAATMPVGSSVSCFRTDSPLANSAASAAITPSMARRPLTISGAAPLKAIREPKDTGAGAPVEAAAATGTGSAVGRLPVAWWVHGRGMCGVGEVRQRERVYRQACMLFSAWEGCRSLS
jgi:hypothetical protein